MSAEILRTAANFMRTRARRVLADLPDARWLAHPNLDADNNGWHVCFETDADGYDTTVAQCEYDYEGELAPHIASWHPVVALAVADWLDREADAHDLAVALNARGLGPDSDAMKVASAYLGDDA